jgi:hypothetical protein
MLNVYNSLYDYLTSSGSLSLSVGIALEIVTKLMSLFTWKLMVEHYC